MARVLITPNPLYYQHNVRIVLNSMGLKFIEHLETGQVAAEVPDSQLDLLRTRASQHRIEEIPEGAHLESAEDGSARIVAPEADVQDVSTEGDGEDSGVTSTTPILDEPSGGD